MKIMVFDVPAESGGALTILKQYYHEALQDRKNEWIFVVSTPQLKESENVKVLNYPWIKKSWFHRLYFDRFVAHKLVEKYEVDEILSLQNVVVPKVEVKQTLYLHQPLPFIDKRYGIFENFKFWIYQNIISKMIFNSIKKADKVIVQTEWLKKVCLDKINVSEDKFIVKQPEIDIQVKKTYTYNGSDQKLFFYPASGFEYKNHAIIVKVVKELVEKKVSGFKVIFTLKENENDHIKKLFYDIQKSNLPIEFIGKIDSEEVYEYYSKSTLIFPSYIETFGLPMLEAKIHGSPILASNCPFSHEILDGYEKVEFFDPFDHQKLYQLMLKTINNNI